MKTILGLDLGTNSIGWAKVSLDDNWNYLHDIKLGCRIIPMSQDVLENFVRVLPCRKLLFAQGLEVCGG